MKKQSPKSGIKQLWKRITGADDKNKKKNLEKISFLIMYDRFREILSLNESLHKLIADIEEKVEGRTPFIIDSMVQKIRKGILDVLVMAKDLNQIADNKYAGLYNTIQAINADIEKEFEEYPSILSGPLIIELSELNAADSMFAGAKMSNLGEVKNEASLIVPNGFAITTAAFNLFMTENDLWEKVNQLKRLIDTFGPAAIEKTAKEVRDAIINAPVPAALEKEIFAAFDKLADGKSIFAAMRSSAIGEDLDSSHAGQYYSELNVSRDGLLDAYRLVLASAFKDYAVSYRYERGLSEADATMAVGCLQMIEPRCAGIIFSRDFREPEADRVEISFTKGLADKVVQGEQNAVQMIIGRNDFSADIEGLLSGEELKSLFDAARLLESHFKMPQDIEWAIDKSGELFILQSRQMAITKSISEIADAQEEGIAPLLQGGHAACPGAGSGKVFIIRDKSDLEKFPRGAVAVARHASPIFSRIMSRAAAIVTDIGSPISHMAILSREFGVPTIVGIEGASEQLSDGKTITVDATRCKIYDGEFKIEIKEPVYNESKNTADRLAVAKLEKVKPLIVPLNLIDPAMPNFTTSGCKSMHDITRFVHENLYDIMFKFGDRASHSLRNLYKLKIELPIEIRIFDLGGGIAEGAGNEGILDAGDIISPPMTAMLTGLTDSRIDWRKPRAVSMKGFMSVVGESMLGPPQAPADLGSVSFSVISDVYLNFSIKAGYHFSIIDAYCEERQNKNYLNFRFAGGGANIERRSRRLKFFTTILSKFNFSIETKGDLLIARLEKFDRDFILNRLIDLGRLTLCSRQMDMLMDSDSSPSFFAEAFLANDFTKF